MEASSLISGNKTIENKSILSFNYIYKKVIIKENFKNTNSEIRSLNYEKIAKYKMKNMNLKYILNSIFKLRNSININNPLFKYIKNAQYYHYKNLKMNISENVHLLDVQLKNNIKNKFPRTDKILNFSQNVKNFKCFYYSRMSNIEYKKINNNKIKKIILIQKHVRGFLSKKIVDEEVNKIIVKIIINKILKLQKAIRQFLNKKKSLSHFIINIIQNERFSKSNKITDIFSLYHFRNLYKKHLLIQKIIKARYKSILKIQSKYRAYILLKKVKDIINKEKNSYVLTYPFNAESVKLKIFMKASYKIYDYFICPIRKYFILYIDKGSINNGEYLCQFIVNNNIVLDKRYKYIVDKNNILYNLIYIGDPPINEIPKKEKKNTQKKNKINDIDNDFFLYCYNENSSSTKSYSNRSDHIKKKSQNNVDNLKRKKDDSFENNNNQKINEFLLNNKKKNLKKNLESKSKLLEYINIGNKTKNTKLLKTENLSVYLKKNIRKNKLIDNNVYIYENQNLTKEERIPNQRFKYNNILDELSSSVSSLSKSHFSMKNINSYSKKTHRTKFCPNKSFKKTPNKKGFLHKSDNLDNVFIYTITSSKYKSIDVNK